MSSPIRPICISGPSGVGKGTIIEALLKKYPKKLAFAISHTTRQPRGKETNGVEYHFITKDEFKSRIEQGDFIEYAEVHGNYYGHSTGPIKEIQSQEKCAILDIDVQGAAQVKKHTGVNPLFVFIQPPSIEELEKRLRGRGTETEEQIAKRMKNAIGELDFGEENFGKIFDFMVVNDSVENSVTQFEKILNEHVLKLN